jgi:LmbE family N-acetylglucosaminyl deacetylase
MIDSNDLIHQADNDQQREFSDKVERMRDDELQAASEYLGADVPAGSSWQDYRDAFAQYSWHDATQAMEHGMGGEDYANI